MERFAAIRERLAATKGERALGVVDGLAGFANLLPTSVVGADGPPAGGDGRLRDLERAGRAVPALHRRRPASRRNYPSGPPAARRGTSRSCPTTATSTWASTSTPAPWPTRAALRDAIEAEFAALIAAGTPKGARRRRADG